MHIADVKSAENNILAEVYHTPRVSAADSNALHVRIINQDSKIVIHVTAPDREILEKATREIFGDDTETFLEWCG